MSDKTDIFPPTTTAWMPEGTIVARFVGVLEQVIVSTHPDGKVLTIIRQGVEPVSVNLDRSAAAHVGRLLLDLPTGAA